jgi:hypothetical protein
MQPVPAKFQKTSYTLEQAGKMVWPLLEACCQLLVCLSNEESAFFALPVFCSVKDRQSATDGVSSAAPLLVAVRYSCCR